MGGQMEKNNSNITPGRARARKKGTPAPNPAQAYTPPVESQRVEEPKARSVEHIGKGQRIEDQQTIRIPSENLFRHGVYLKVIQYDEGPRGFIFYLGEGKRVGENTLVYRVVGESENKADGSRFYDCVCLHGEEAEEARRRIRIDR